LIVLFLMGEVHAQIKIQSDGRVLIRSTSIPSDVGIYMNGQAEIYGNMYFSNSYGRSLSISSNYLHAFIEPNVTNRGYLGTSSKQFSQIHAQTYYCNGTAFQGSDLKFKENIRQIEKPLQTLLLLNGKKYDFKVDSTDIRGTQEEVAENIALKKNKYGFIAQEVKEILPDLTHYNKENDKLYLDYTAFIPIIVEAFKEQQSLIVDLHKELAQLKSISSLKSATINGDTDHLNSNAATLSQNIPNPFPNNTRIDIYLPGTVNNANLYVYNMQGVQIKSFSISERGNTSVTIEGYTLQAGMYLYTLIADGKEVDTRKMILTK
jgi:hypothetical protein